MSYDKGELMYEELKKTGLFDTRDFTYAYMILPNKRLDELVDQFDNE